MTGHEFMLPFEDYMVDVDEWDRSGRVSAVSGLAHGTAAKAQPTLARPAGRAISGPMIECRHLLPHGQCSLCAELVEDLEDPTWERHDYAQEDLTSGEVEVQEYPEDEVQPGEVDPRDIFGTHEARRLSKTS